MTKETIEEKTKHLPYLKNPSRGDSNPIPFVEMAEVVLRPTREDSYPHNEIPQRRAIVYVAGRNGDGIVMGTMVRDDNGCLMDPATSFYFNFLDYRPLGR